MLLGLMGSWVVQLWAAAAQEIEAAGHPTIDRFLVLKKKIKRNKYTHFKRVHTGSEGMVEGQNWYQNVLCKRNKIDNISAIKNSSEAVKLWVKFTSFLRQSRGGQLKAAGGLIIHKTFDGKIGSQKTDDWSPPAGEDGELEFHYSINKKNCTLDHKTKKEKKKRARNKTKSNHA